MSLFMYAIPTKSIIQEATRNAGFWIRILSLMFGVVGLMFNVYMYNIQHEEAENIDRCGRKNSLLLSSVSPEGRRMLEKIADYGEVSALRSPALACGMDILLILAVLKGNPILVDPWYFAALADLLTLGLSLGLSSVILYPYHGLSRQLAGFVFTGAAFIAGYGFAVMIVHETREILRKETYNGRFREICL